MLMAQMPLQSPSHNDAQVVNVGMLPRFFEFLYARWPRGSVGKRHKVLYGGAGSGKSYSVAQYVATLFATVPDLKILVARKTGPSLRLTCWPVLNEILRGWGVPYDANRTHLDMVRGNTTINMRAIDDPEKVKSAEFNLIWCEEPTELSNDEFRQLDLRLRRSHKTLPQQMLFTFNPISSTHWLITELVQGDRPDVAVMHSTYKDNPFLPQTAVDILEDLINRDENFYRVYTLGQPGVLRNLIYHNWEVREEVLWPERVRTRPPDYYGVDWGSNDPTVLIGVWREERAYYLKEVYYQPQSNTRKLVEWMEKHGVNHSSPMSCDPSRPDQIVTLKEAGFAAVPAERARVADGIDFISGQRLVIAPDAVNLLDELRSYKWREDKDKHPLDVPVDYNDHAMDAMRYAIHTFRPHGGNWQPNSDMVFGSGILDMGW